MSYPHDSSLVGFSRQLRKTMTPEERHLWYDFLKKLPVTVNRQKVVGSYILDFYIAEKRLCIELDGGQHRLSEHAEYDRARDEFLQNLGIMVLRYSNADIWQRFDSVCGEILQLLGLTKEDIGKKGH